MTRLWVVEKQERNWMAWEPVDIAWSRADARKKKPYLKQWAYPTKFRVVEYVRRTK